MIDAFFQYAYSRKDIPIIYLAFAIASAVIASGFAVLEALVGRIEVPEGSFLLSIFISAAASVLLALNRVKLAKIAGFSTGSPGNVHGDTSMAGKGSFFRSLPREKKSQSRVLEYPEIKALESDQNSLTKVQSATIDTLAEGVAVFGPDGKLKLHNTAFARMWELGDNELNGEPHVSTVTQTLTERFGNSALWDRLVQTVVSGVATKLDLGEVERIDRTILKLGLSPLPDGATLAIFADVTDRFRIESAFRDRDDALEAADRLKSDFIKHVSYQLRVPVNTIHGFSEHLASGVPGSLSGRQEEYVRAIVESSTQLRSLINDILDLALVEAGAFRLAPECIDLYGLLVDVTNHAGEWASKMDIELKLECLLGAGIFLADQRRMRQIVFSLLSNAFKFTPRGGSIVLSGRIVGEDVQISVADNGPGIAADIKADVFERFTARSQSGQPAGAGLGLTLVNRFLELHDGWVEIETGNKANGGGTLVRCHIPRRGQFQQSAVGHE